MSQQLLARRLALAVIVAGFGYGTTTHALDFIRFGFAPYQFGPPLFNLFWNSLVLLDLSVVVLLALRMRRTALAAGLLIMIADVSINFYASQVLFEPYDFGFALLAQALFLGFLVGATPFLWPDPEVRAE